MYVSKLRIRNYRNFSDFEIELRPFTLIIGENNSGKTNLLNALGLVFSQDITYFRKRMLEYEDINYEAVRGFKRDIVQGMFPAEDIEFPEVRVEVEMEDFTSAQERAVGDWFTDNSLSRAQLTYSFRTRNRLPKSEWIAKQRAKIAAMKKEEGETDDTFLDRKIDSIDLPLKDYEYIISGGEDTSKRAEAYFLSMLRIEVLDALRDASRELMASRDYRLLYRVLNSRDEAGFLDIKEALARLESLISKNPELRKMKKEIRDYLDRISLYEKELENRVEFQFSSPECCEILKKIGLVYGESPVNVTRNGLGRNNLLYISLVLSHLTGTASADDVCFRLIGIEEPEAHLHPHLQDHLARNLRSEVEDPKELQMILTSHSSNIAGKLDLENTVILYKDRDGAVKTHYVLSNFGKASSEKKTIRYLKKFLDATNSGMFFARRVVLVEGISEQLLIPMLFKIHKARIPEEYIRSFFGDDGSSWRNFFEKCDGGGLSFRADFEDVLANTAMENKQRYSLLDTWRRFHNKTMERIGCNVVNVNGIAFRHFLDVIKNGYFVRCLVLTDKDPNAKGDNRAESLQKDYADVEVILVKNTNASTFEKDIIESNRNGRGKEILFNALVETRPRTGQALKDSTGDSDFDTESFFEEIEYYKSEFAFNLVEELKKDSEDFVTPAYISEGFDFLLS